MNANLTRDDLRNLTRATAKLAPRAASKPIFGMIKLEAKGNHLTAAATNGEQALVLRAVADVKAEGVAVVDALRLSAIAANVPDQVVAIEADGNNLRVAANDAIWTLGCANPSEYPSSPKKLNSEALIASYGQLKACLDAVKGSAAKENNRYAINGVLMCVEADDYRLVATDGRRISVAEAGKGQDGQKPCKVILPLSSVQVFCGLGLPEDETVRVYVDDLDKPKAVVFASRDMNLRTCVVEGTYPDWRGVMPDAKAATTTVEVEAPDLLRATRQASILVNAESKGVRLSIADGHIRLSSREPEMGEAEVNIKCGLAGEPIEIGFNPDFLAATVAGVDGVAKLYMTKPSQPLLVELVGDDVRHVVMPVNLQ